MYGGVSHPLERINSEIIASFEAIKPGDFIFFYVRNVGVYGLWRATSLPFFDTSDFWDDKEQKFPCPCHGAACDIRGEVISPPATRALDIYHLFIENRMVKVDTSKQNKRSGFRADQVVYPKKV